MTGPNVRWLLGARGQRRVVTRSYRGVTLVVWCDDTRQMAEGWLTKSSRAECWLTKSSRRVLPHAELSRGWDEVEKGEGGGRGRCGSDPFDKCGQWYAAGLKHRVPGSGVPL